MSRQTSLATLGTFFYATVFFVAVFLLAVARFVDFDAVDLPEGFMVGCDALAMSYLRVMRVKKKKPRR